MLFENLWIDNSDILRSICFVLGSTPYCSARLNSAVLGYARLNSAVLGCVLFCSDRVRKPNVILTFLTRNTFNSWTELSTVRWVIGIWGYSRPHVLLSRDKKLLYCSRNHIYYYSITNPVIWLANLLPVYQPSSENLVFKISTLNRRIFLFLWSVRWYDWTTSWFLLTLTIRLLALSSYGLIFHSELRSSSTISP